MSVFVKNAMPLRRRQRPTVKQAKQGQETTGSSKQESSPVAVTKMEGKENFETRMARVKQIQDKYFTKRSTPENQPKQTPPRTSVYSKETLRSLLWDMSSTPEKEEMARQVPNTSSISSGKRKLDPEFEQPTTKKARIVRLNSSQLYAEAKQFKKLGDSISHEPEINLFSKLVHYIDAAMFFLASGVKQDSPKMLTETLAFCRVFDQLKLLDCSPRKGQLEVISSQIMSWINLHLHRFNAAKYQALKNKLRDVNGKLLPNPSFEDLEEYLKTSDLLNSAHDSWNRASAIISNAPANVDFFENLGSIGLTSDIDLVLDYVTQATDQLRSTCHPSKQSSSPHFNDRT